jgi:hypothetical protein
LSWDGDEPNMVATEEVSAPVTEESAPLPQAETVAPGHRGYAAGSHYGRR